MTLCLACRRAVPDITDEEYSKAIRENEAVLVSMRRKIEELKANIADFRCEDQSK